jgi:Mrp family chromosome partitioning ATPase
MDNIRQALERARTLDAGLVKNQDATTRSTSPAQAAAEPRARQVNKNQEITLNLRDLEFKRIIAHDDTDPRTRAFDILRTEVLQLIDQKNWNVVGITSPTPGCGKTVTAINLAFSIARHPHRSALVVDLDLRKPEVATSIGVNCRSGILGVLTGQTDLSSAIVQVRAGDYAIAVLPAEGPASDSAAWMASRAMSTVLQDIKRDYRSHTIILDLPPTLVSDDVLALLPQLDCVLLVTAVGKSRVSEVEESMRHLQHTEVVRIVLNKVPKLHSQYYTYYYLPKR